MRNQCIILVVVMSLITFVVTSCNENNSATIPPGSIVEADSNNAGLKLPAGFHALIVADNIGQARHLAVAANGDIFVKLGSLKDDRGIVQLHDSDRNGKADVITGFGNYGGTGIAIKNGYLYATSDNEIFRYPMDKDYQVTNPGQPEKIVTGLLNRFQHSSKSITLDNSGDVYVNIGAYSNSCQEQDRTKGSPGMNPCPILDSAGGIWRFKADGKNQTYGDGIQYATGLRNVVGLDWNTEINSLFVMMHGRDQLYEFYPDIYTKEQGSELPAETMYQLKHGDDAGWPYIYYDHLQQKKILSPEYGGDGKKTGGDKAIDPVIAFPGHLAPNGLLFYTGNMFPAKYKNGAFIAFHGSWNRANSQKGYFVAFVPFDKGRPSGPWEIFADNFAGATDIPSPSQAKHRPCGLAQGPDGSLYVSDDVQGTIYRIIYK